MRVDFVPVRPCVGECLHVFSQEEDLKDAILLVFANKQDMPGALNAAQVAVYL